MEIKFVNLEPAFNGVRGWITVSELEAIDPSIPENIKRFSAKSRDWN